MARVNNGFLGDASGKLGNVVFSKWRRMFTARKYQPEIHDANSQLQQKQRSRMLVLLNFLKPLNKTFIRNFNYACEGRSTPWAKAIKENMPAVSADGKILLKHFVLGDPHLPELSILQAVYNPFIDQIQLAYQIPVIPKETNPFPYIGISALGRYKSSAAAPSFDIRHLLVNMPDGYWYCWLSDEVESDYYYNWWEGGRLWLLLDEEDRFKTSSNPFHNISAPAYFEPASIVEGFNTAIKKDIVPVNALSWQYKHESNVFYIDFNIDFAKTKLKTPADYTLILWADALISGNHYFSGPYEWNLQESTYEIIMGPNGLPGSALCLYAIFDKHGNQVSRFDRFYISKGTDNNEYPYLQQIFDCNYSHPASFQLSGKQCGFCGSLDELFSDFIELWEQGIIYDHSEPEPVTEFGLTIPPPTGGVLQASGYLRAANNTYVFSANQQAQLAPVPAQGKVFANFTGPDAADVVPTADGHYQLAMTKERMVSAVFNPA